MVMCVWTCLVSFIWDVLENGNKVSVALIKRTCFSCSCGNTLPPVTDGRWEYPVLQQSAGLWLTWVTSRVPGVCARVTLIVAVHARPLALTHGVEGRMNWESVTERLCILLLWSCPFRGCASLCGGVSHACRWACSIRPCCSPGFTFLYKL